MSTTYAHAGDILADRLGIAVIGTEGHDLRCACIACDSSDAMRIHRERGVGQCYSCGSSWSPLALAQHMLSDRERAKQLLIELGIFEDRRPLAAINGYGHGDNNNPPATPAADPIDILARQKGITAAALRAFGATAKGAIVVVPMYDARGEQCSEFRMFAASSAKGKNQQGKKAGLFLPHTTPEGAVRLPQPGETWHLVEGCKDASALYSLGMLAAGMPTCQLATKFAPLFIGVDVVVVPDHDEAGENGAEQTAARLARKAASVRIASLPGELKQSGGDDVRDVLRKPDGREMLLHALETAREWVPSGSARKKPDEPKPLAIEFPEARTDVANGRRLVRDRRDVLRFCQQWKKWLTWDGCRWAVDDAATVAGFAKDVADNLITEARDTYNKSKDKDLFDACISYFKTSSTARGIYAAMTLAASEPGIQIKPEQLDQDPLLLNVRNGTVDLRTGDLLPHQQSNYITKLSPVDYDSNADCPRFLDFIRCVLADDANLIAFIQRLAGYFLTGSTREQILPIFYGNGANGKSTLIGVLLDLLGDDYAIKAENHLLIQSASERHPTGQCDLFGKRLAACIETEEGHRLNESLIKEMTGGDKIRARRMYEDFWEFSPTHKLLLSTNHRPEVRGTDHAIWRRLRLVPFAVTIPEAQRDYDLPDKLRQELPGILRWAIDGCLAWQRERQLVSPECVIVATEGYRADMDQLGQFISQCCMVNSGVKVRANALYDAYRKWAETGGERYLTQKKFGGAISEKFERETSNGTWYRGIAIRDWD